MGDMDDYPAAHSMDSTWFAVDEDGHIAAFDTGEDGHIPEGFPVWADPWNEELIARTLLARAQTDERFRELRGYSVQELVRLLQEGDAYEISVALMRSLGIWVYEFCGWIYARSGSVPEPARLGDLCEESQQWLKDARIPVSFQKSRVLAPGEYFPVSGWRGEHWLDWEGHLREQPEEEPQELSAAEAKRHRQFQNDVEKWLISAEARPLIPNELLPEVVAELLTGSSEHRPDWWRQFEY